MIGVLAAIAVVTLFVVATRAPLRHAALGAVGAGAMSVNGMLTRGILRLLGGLVLIDGVYTITLHHVAAGVLLIVAGLTTTALAEWMKQAAQGARQQAHDAQVRHDARIAAEEAGHVIDKNHERRSERDRSKEHGEWLS